MANEQNIEYWLPQAGPQAAAAVCPVDEIFFGGTRGGGKSDAGIGRQVHGALTWGKWWNGLFIRRRYQDLKEVRRRFDELISEGMPATRVGGEEQTNYIRFHDGPAKGAVIVLTAIWMLRQVDSFQGHQYTEITIDEAPAIPFISQLIDNLKGCLRSPHGVPCSMFLTGNPGGAGAGQIKTMYIPRSESGGNPKGESEVHVIRQDLPDGGTYEFSRVFIRSSIEDNKILTDMDPGYWARLLSINNEPLRIAWTEGRWDVFVGQAFSFGPAHIIDPIWPIPKHAPLYMTFDWGFGAPFSIGWWWVDADDRIYRFAEWYGWDGITPNVGLRLEDPKIAQGILEREEQMGILGRPIMRLTGPDSFSKKPDYKGGGQGPSTSEEFQWYMNRPEVKERFGDTISLVLYPGDPSRELKIRQFRNRLMVPMDVNNKPTGELPKLVVYSSCEDFIKIIPSLCVDELTKEYLEPGQELHPFDEACHICMARPIGADLDNINRQQVKEQKEAARRKLDSASREAAKEYEAILERLMESGANLSPDDARWRELAMGRVPI
jgi:hypothetical protein